MTNLQESLAGTDPDDPDSVLRFSMERQGNDLMFRWTDLSYKTQRLLSSDRLETWAIEPAATAAGFPNHWISQQLMGAVKTIAIRQRLKLARQTIFVEYGGWDHHAELLETQAGMLRILDGALYAFQKALEALGLTDDVVTFTASDFGRTLRSNGQGTDHAWSGNQFVMGGPVHGGVVCGRFPSLEIDGLDDVGRGGRIFPRLSADEVFCEMLRWFGVSSGDMEQVLPNIRNFYGAGNAINPVGFL